MAARATSCCRPVKPARLRTPPETLADTSRRLREASLGLGQGASPVSKGTMATSLANLAGLDRSELEHFMLELSEPAYRAGQVMRWLYSTSAESFDEMTDLPAALRGRLSRIARLRVLEPGGSFASADGTQKLAFRLEDGEVIETVIIPAQKRSSVCISTQAGCAFGCIFCASGARGLVRDLTAGEIVEQVVRARAIAQGPVSNVVLMGMGEPLANYTNTLKAIRLISNPKAIGIGQRRIAVSTSGLVPQIRQLAQEKLQIHLAVSLHAPNDDLRRKLMPVSGRYLIASLLEACREYFEQTGRKVMFEYILIRGLNDSVSMARSLARRVRAFPCMVNLIPMNSVEFRPDLTGSDSRKVREFASILRNGGVEVAVRRPHGEDIAAACGQLAGRLKTP